MPGMLILAACDRQQAAIERHEADPGRALLRLQLPARPDPRSYRDWSWVAVPLALPPTVPAAAALHLPTLRVAGGRVRADVAFTYPVPQARRDGHTVALGVDWGLNTLLSAGAVRLRPDGSITALGAGAQYRAGGVLAQGSTGSAGTASDSTPSSATTSGSPPGAKPHPLDGESRGPPGRGPPRRGPPVAPERRPRLVRRPVGGRPGHRRRGDASSTSRTCGRWRPAGWAAP